MTGRGAAERFAQGRRALRAEGVIAEARHVEETSRSDTRRLRPLRRDGPGGTPDSRTGHRPLILATKNAATISEPITIRASQK